MPRSADYEKSIQRMRKLLEAQLDIAEAMAGRGQFISPSSAQSIAELSRAVKHAEDS